MARMWHGCQIITENKEWILFQQFEKYICGMCIFCQCPLMLKFSMESLLLVNDLEIWENLFFLTLKLVGKHPRLGKKKPSSVQVQHQQGVVPAKPYSCTQTSLLFGGHEGTEKDPVQKKKKRQTFNKQTNQTHKSSFYQHGSMKIQEKKSQTLAVGNRTGWKGRANPQPLQSCTQVLVRQVSHLSSFTEDNILVCIYGVLLGGAWWYQAAVHENKVGTHGGDPCFKAQKMPFSEKHLLPLFCDAFHHW